MWTVIVKNSSGTDQTVGDLGITIANGDQVNFSE